MKDHDFEIRPFDYLLILVLVLGLYGTTINRTLSYGLESYMAAGPARGAFLFGGVYVLLARMLGVIVPDNQLMIIKSINIIFSYASLLILLRILNLCGIRRWAMLLTIATVSLHFSFYSASVRPDPVLATLCLFGLTLYNGIAGLLTRETKYFWRNVFFYAFSFIHSPASLVLIPAELFVFSRVSVSRQRYAMYGLAVILPILILGAQLLLLSTGTTGASGVDAALISIKQWYTFGITDWVMNNLRLLCNWLYGFPVLGFCFMVTGMILCFRIYRDIGIFLVLVIAGFILFNAVSAAGSEKLDLVVFYISGIFIGITLNRIAGWEYPSYERWFTTASLCFLLLILLPLFLYAATPTVLYSYKIRPRLHEYPAMKYPVIRPDLEFRDTIREYFKPWYMAGISLIQIKNEVRLQIPATGKIMVDPELYFSLYDGNQRVVFVHPDEQLAYIDRVLASGGAVFIISIEDYYYRKNEILERYHLMKRGSLLEIVRKGDEWQKIIH